MPLNLTRVVSWGWATPVASHANIVSANQTFRVNDRGDSIDAPFFDIEDEYHVQVDLWLISSVGVELMDLLYRGQPDTRCN